MFQKVMVKNNFYDSLAQIGHKVNDAITELVLLYSESFTMVAIFMFHNTAN